MKSTSIPTTLCAFLFLLGAFWIVLSSTFVPVSHTPQKDVIPAAFLSSTTQNVPPTSQLPSLPSRVENQIPVPNDFTTAPIRQESETVNADGHRVQVRVVELPSESVPVRIEEVWRRDARTGDKILVRREVMLADRVVADVETPKARLALEAAAAAHGYRVAAAPSHSPFVVVLLGEDSPEAVPLAIQRLTNKKKTAYLVSPDHLHFPTHQPNDPSVWRQWALERMNATEAWQTSTGSSDLTVAIIDSGIALNHPDLAANIWRNPGEADGNKLDDDGNGFIDDIQGWNFVENNNRPADTTGHGTHIAGIIGAVTNNATGIAGINWEVGLLPLRVGSDTFSTSRIVQALDYVVDLKNNRGINIVATNNSYGSDSSNSVLRNAILRTRDAGILFVASAGNQGFDMDKEKKMYPAAYDFDHMITVAATTSEATLANFSNYGQTFVHLGAPGNLIYSTTLNDGYGHMNGTSMATPMVTGAIALVMASEPSLDWQTTRSLLLQNVDPIPALEGKTVTGGRLNLQRAVEAFRASIPFEITSPGSGLIRFSDTNMNLYLEALLDPENEFSMADSDVTWESIQGPLPVQFHSSGSRSTTVRFPAVGDYILRGASRYGDHAIFTESIHVHIGSGELLAGGLSGYWKFNEGADGIAHDSSGKGRNAILGPGVSWTEGRIHGGLYFNGDGSRVDFAAPATKQVTISAWVRSDSMGNSIFPRIAEGPEHILFFGRDAIGTDPANRNTIKFYAERTDSPGVWHSPPGSISDDQWYHVTVTYDGSEIRSSPLIYLNGEPQPIAVQVAPAGDRAGTGTAWGVGDTRSLSELRSWDGRIDELRIYDRILTPAEVLALANEPEVAVMPKIAPTVTQLSFSSANLKAYFNDTPYPPSDLEIAWTVTEGPGTVLIDDPTAADTNATFSEPGTYELLLTIEANKVRFLQTVKVTILSRPEVSISINRPRTLRSPLYPVTVRIKASDIWQGDLPVLLTADGIGVENVDNTPLPEQVILRADNPEAFFQLIPIASDEQVESVVRIRIEPDPRYEVSGSGEVELDILAHHFTNWLSVFMNETRGEEEYLPTETSAARPQTLLDYALAVPLVGMHSKPPSEMPRSNMIQIGENHYLTLSYRRPIDIRDIAYEVEVSPDMHSWESGATIQTASQTMGDGREEVTIRDTVPLSTTDSRFMRLRVRLLGLESD